MVMRNFGLIIVGDEILSGKRQDKHMAKVINIASIDGISVNPWETYSYSASKAGVIHLTKRMSLEMIKDGICVNAIAPGLVLVEATAYVPQERHDYYLKGRAIQRPQVPEDVNAAALFLLTQASGFITGQLLPVNGGFVMH